MSPFVPGKPDESATVKLSELCKQRYTEDVKTITGKNKKDYLDLYERRWKSLKSRFDEHEVYTEAGAQVYLDKLVGEIRRGNAGLEKLAFNCMFSREPIPNASYSGEGVILFNMGLFSRLHSESEAAFVLCHEIAHCLLRHSENSISKYVETVNSDEVQKQLRSIKSLEYGKREQLDKMMKGLTFDSRRHSRDHEAQADSMAVELMQHTRFSLQGALSALEVLDEVDKDSLRTGECLQKIFNAPEYPFQKKWIAKDGGLLGGHAQLKEVEMADSLKTHPECKQRIGLLKPFVEKGGLSGAGAFPIDSGNFVKLQDRFRYEIIEYAYESNRYTLCLFLSLQFIEKRPGDPYLVSQLGKVMNGLYAAQKEHTLGHVASLPRPGIPANYNFLLQFVQNLYRENISGISYYFLKQYHPSLDHYGAYKDALTQSEKNFQAEQ